MNKTFQCLFDIIWHFSCGNLWNKMNLCVVHPPPLRIYIECITYCLQDLRSGCMQLVSYFKKTTNFKSTLHNGLDRINNSKLLSRLLLLIQWKDAKLIYRFISPATAKKWTKQWFWGSWCRNYGDLNFPRIPSLHI